MLELQRNFWPGARAPACRRSAPCSRCTSPPGSRPAHASSRRRASSNGSLRSATCSTGSSPARLCRSTLASVRGPRHVVTSGQTPVLDPEEARALLDSIDTASVVGSRDRALIGLMVYSFARIGAALGMAVEDVYTQNRRLWVRLRDKGGKRHAMPCHHNLEEYLIACLDGAGLRGDQRGPCSARSVAARASSPARCCSRRTSMR
jgi:integrase